MKGPTPKSPATRFWSNVQQASLDACWLWTGKSMQGKYGKFYAKVNGKPKYFSSSRAAFILHNGLPLDLDPKVLVRHSCDNPPCCNPNHLLLGTPKQNSEDMVTRNRNHKGSTHRNSKLNEEQVFEIRRLHSQKTSQAELSRLFGVDSQTIFNIVHRHSWKHFKEIA